MSKESVLELYDNIEKSVNLLSKELSSSYLEALAETLQNIYFGGKAQQIDNLPSNETIDKLNKLYANVKKITDSSIGYA